jgi:hypothetical protein
MIVNIYFKIFLLIIFQICKAQKYTSNNNKISTSTARFQNFSSINSDFKLKNKRTHSSDDNKKVQKLKARRLNQMICLIDFEVIVQDFVDFKPKEGKITLDVTFKFKWSPMISTQNTIKASNQSSRSSSNLNKKIDFVQKFNSTPNRKSFFYPKFKYKTAKSSDEIIITNEIHNTNLQSEYSKITQSFNSYLNENDEREDYDSISDSNSRSNTQQQQNDFYSYLEQNATLNFECQMKNEDAIGRTLDTSKFPFDTHECQFDIELMPLVMPILIKVKNETKDNNITTARDKLISPPSITLYAFSKFNQLFNFNKLVTKPNNSSWIAREWLLKKVVLLYQNSTNVFSKIQIKVNQKLIYSFIVNIFIIFII